jgi:hypothetical protein
VQEQEIQWIYPNADLKQIVANMAFPNKRNVTPRYQQISSSR